MIDGLGLMQKGVSAVGASGHGASECGINGEMIPRLAGAERPVRLIEWLLGEEERAVQFGFQRASQRPVAGAKFGLKMVAVFVNDVIEGDDGIQAHRNVMSTG